MLKISRGKAYELARRYLETDGSEGLPVVAFGRCFRVPRAGLEQMLGGQLHWTRVPKPPPPAVVNDEPPALTDPPVSRPPRRRRSRNDAQLNLFEPPPSDSPERPR